MKIKLTNKREKGTQEIQERKITIKEITETVTFKVVAFAVFVFFITRFVFFTSIIQSGSMEPTLCTTDFVIGNRLAYMFHEPENGDIIFFKHNGECWGKRVIAVGGDTLEYTSQGWLLNGEALEEDYLPEGTVTEPWYGCKFEVPDGKMFVMGDNREFSYDSRRWHEEQYVSVDDVIAKSIFVIPVHKWSKIYKEEQEQYEKLQAGDSL